MKVKELLDSLDLRNVAPEQIGWELYKNGKEIGGGMIRASFRITMKQLCEEYGIEYKEVEEWVKETEKQIYEPEIDPNRPPFVYFPSGLMELNKELDKEIERMEKKKEKEKLK